MGKELAEVRDYNKLSETISMACDIITKDYLGRLKELEVCEIPWELKKLDIAQYARFYRFKKLVTDKKENTIDKLVTVLNAAYSSNATVVALIRGNRSEVEYYLGVVSKDITQHTEDISTQGEIFKGTLTGNFPGLSLDSLNRDEIKSMCDEIFQNDNITAVSGLSSIRKEDSTEMEQFVQGLEHLVDALEGRTYSIVVIADPVGKGELNQAKNGYESLYTQLSPFSNTTLSFNETDSFSVTQTHTEGFTHTVSESVTQTQNYTETSGWNHGESHGTSESKGMGRAIGTVLGVGAIAALTVATGGLGGAFAAAIAGAGATATATGAAVLGAGGLAAMVGGSFGETVSGNKGRNDSENSSQSGSNASGHGRSEQSGRSDSEQQNESEGTMQGESRGRTLQFSNENRTVKDLLQKIDRNVERIEKCESFGAFNCAAYVISSDPETNAVVANGYSALMKGENSFLQSSHISQWTRGEEGEREIKEYLKKFTHPVFKCDSAGEALVSPASLESAYEVAVGIGLPKRSVNGLPVMESASFGRNIYRLADEEEDRSKFRLGNIFHMGKREPQNFVDLFTESMSMHTFITGSTGSGKSNTVYQILNELRKKGIQFLVVEPAKGEYKNVFGGSVAKVYGTNPACTPLLRINPFKFDRGIHVLEHVDRLVEIFNVCWPMYAAMPAVLKEAVLRAYEVCGWDLVRSVNTIDQNLFPTFRDLLEELVEVIDKSAYDIEVKSNYKGSLETRVKSLTNGLNGMIFSADEIEEKDLFDTNAIVDLSRVGSLETKSLIMGVLVMRLNEYRMTHADGMNLPLKHVTVLEEAHNILKRTSTEQDIEGANMAGKSVEMISNAIAEMRTYGEGFIIADQSPGAVDISAIRNTNTKIIMRLPEENDRRIAGKSAALKEEQMDEIAKLPRGVAVVYQNDWIEPVLCQISKFNGKETRYEYHPKEDTASETADKDAWLRSELIKLLVKGRINEPVEVDVKELKAELPKADLSTKNRIGFYRMLEEYEKTGKLAAWDDRNFGALSSLVVELLSCQNEVEQMVRSSKDFESLNLELEHLIRRQFRDASEELSLTLSQCFMKDYSVKAKENLEIYSAWWETVKKRGGLL